MQIICTLAGANFRPADAKNILRQAQLGDVIHLEPDPNNEYDPAAVKVMLEGYHIGFVPRDSNGPVSEKLLAGDVLSASIVAFESVFKPVLEITL